MLKFIHHLQAFFRSQGIRQSLVVMFGNAAAQCFSAVALILISRLLGPSRFGEFSLGFALALILNRFSDLGLSFAVQKFIPKAQSKNEINRLVSYTTLVKGWVVVSQIALGLLSYQWLAELLQFQNSTIILCAFLFSPATVLYEHFQAVLQSLHRFSLSVLMNTAQAVLKAAAAVAIWFGGVSSTTAILIIYLLAPLFPVLFIKRLLPSWMSITPFSGNFSSERSMTKALMSHAAVGYVTAGIIENIDILFVQRFLDTYEAGLLGGVSRVALLFSLLAYSLGTVLNPRVAAYTSIHQLNSFMKKSLLLLVACVVGFIIYLMLANWILILTVGQSYLSGINVMNTLVASSFLTIAVMPFIALFFSLDAPWYFSISGVLQLIIIVTGNVVFLPIYGLEATAWTKLVSRAVLFLFTVGVSMYLYHQKRRSSHVGQRRS